MAETVTMMGPPSNALKPQTLVQLQEMVRSTPKIRPFAALRSGMIWPSDQYIDMTGLKQVLKIDEETVTCEAGLPLGELLEKLSLHQRTIPTLPSIIYATIGGLISSGSHGSGAPTISSFVRSLTLVTADGSLLTINRGDPLFPYAAVSVGLLGIIYSCTIETAVDKPLYQQRKYASLPEDPVTWLQGGLYRQFFYNPYTGKALLYDHAYQPIFGKDKRPLLDILLNNNNGERLAVEVYNEAPNLMPHFINLVYQVLSGRSSGGSQKVLTIPEYKVEFIDYECAVPVAVAAETLKKLQALVVKWRHTRQYNLWFGILVRYLKRDRAILAPSYGGDMVTFEFPLYNSDESMSFIDEAQKLLGNRFHPGKYNPFPIMTHNGWDEFNKQRQLLDPTDKFYPDFS